MQHNPFKQHIPEDNVDWVHFWTKVFPIIKDRLIKLSDILEYRYLFKKKK